MSEVESRCVLSLQQFCPKGKNAATSAGISAACKRLVCSKTSLPRLSMTHTNYLIILLLLGFSVYSMAVAPSVIVKDLKLFVDGTEFIVKGFSYQPMPLG